MSENLDLVRSICAPFARGDWSSIEWVDPEIEFVVGDGPLAGKWTGLSVYFDREHALADLGLAD